MTIPESSMRETYNDIAGLSHAFWRKNACFGRKSTLICSKNDRLSKCHIMTFLCVFNVVLSILRLRRLLLEPKNEKYIDF